MRLPLDGAAPRRAQLATAVEAVLTSMLLTHVRGALVGEASGGERKRTNVALELVAEPACLVVDEVRDLPRSPPILPQRCYLATTSSRLLPAVSCSPPRASTPLPPSKSHDASSTPPRCWGSQC